MAKGALWRPDDRTEEGREELEVRGSLTTQLELGDDLLAGDVAHEEGEAPGIAEAGGQPVEQRPGGLVDAGAQSLLRLGGGEGPR